MDTFKTFVGEDELPLDVPTVSQMCARVGSPLGDRHVRAYLSQEMRESTLYTLAKRWDGMEAGTELRIEDVEVDENTYYAIAVPLNELLDTSKKTKKKVPISKLAKPKKGRVGIHNERVEAAAINHLHKQIKEKMAETGKNHIELHHNGKVYKVAGAKKVTSGAKKGVRAKADFYLHDEKKHPVFFGSHKAGVDPKSFQQYGGVTDIEHHPAVKEFANRLGKVASHEHGVGAGRTIAMHLNPHNKDHVALMKHSMFGMHHDSHEHSAENVHAIFHGQMNLKHRGGRTTLHADKVVNNDHKFRPEHHGTSIYARSSSDRATMGFKKTRMMIAPHGSRKVAQTIGDKYHHEE